MKADIVAISDDLVKSLDQMVVTTSTPSACFESLPREIRDKIYGYLYQRPADNLDFVWVPRTTFAVNRQLYSEAQLCLLKRHVFVKISLRLRPEFRTWILKEQATRGWIIQTEQSGAVTRFKHYHMHVQIGPTKKQVPLTSMMILGHESLLNFCMRLLTFSTRSHDSNTSTRRLRIRITCLKPFESEVINKQQECDLFESLLTLWWSFADVQTTSAIDKEVASRTQKLLSEEKWNSPEDFLLFLYACDVTSLLAIANGQLQVAVQICSRERCLINVMSNSLQLANWQLNPAIAQRWNESLTQFQLIDLELYTRLAQAAKSANAEEGFLETAYAIHSDLKRSVDGDIAVDSDTNIQIVYLLAVCGRYHLEFDKALKCINKAIAIRPDDRRLYRERVILNILTDKNLSETTRREKANEFRSSPIGQSDFNTKLVSAADLWGLSPMASPKEQQIAIIEGMRALNAGELNARIYL